MKELWRRRRWWWLFVVVVVVVDRLGEQCHDFGRGAM